MKVKLPGMCRYCRSQIAPGTEVLEVILPGSDRKKWLCPTCAPQYESGSIAWSDAMRDLAPVTQKEAPKEVEYPVIESHSPPVNHPSGAAPLVEIVRKIEVVQIIANGEVVWETPMAMGAAAYMSERYEMAWRTRLEIASEQRADLVPIRKAIMDDEAKSTAKPADVQQEAVASLPNSSTLTIAGRTKGRDYKATIRQSAMLDDVATLTVTENGKVTYESSFDFVPAGRGMVHAVLDQFSQCKRAADVSDMPEHSDMFGALMGGHVEAFGEQSPGIPAANYGVDDLPRAKKTWGAGQGQSPKTPEPEPTKPAEPVDLEYPKPIPRRGRKAKDKGYQSRLELQSKQGERTFTARWEPHRDEGVNTAVCSFNIDGKAVKFDAFERNERTEVEALTQLHDFVMSYMSIDAEEEDELEAYEDMMTTLTERLSELGHQPGAEAHGPAENPPVTPAEQADPEPVKEPETAPPEPVEPEPDEVPEVDRELTEPEVEKAPEPELPQSVDPIPESDSPPVEIPHPSGHVGWTYRIGKAFADAVALALPDDNGTGAEMDEGRVREIIREELEAVCVRERVAPCRTQEGVKLVPGVVRHELFEQVLEFAQQRLNVLLIGPSQSGKTTLGRQVAEALGLPFYAVSCSIGMTESTLKGRLLPGGNGPAHIETPWLKGYRDGGVVLLDEIDAASAEVSVVINDSLSSNEWFNDLVTEGNGRIQRHPDFICIAAANTIGYGASRMYVARQRLDFSTLQRFAFAQLMVGYSEAIETAVCPDEGLRLMCLKVREAIEICNSDGVSIMRAMTTRFMVDAYKMLRAGWTPERCLRQFFVGWSTDEVASVFPGGLDELGISLE